MPDTSLLEQVKKVVAVGEAIIETVEEVSKEPEFVGAPEGVIYAALMTKVPNFTLEQFNQIKQLCISSGRLRQGPMHTLLPGLSKAELAQRRDAKGKFGAGL